MKSMVFREAVFLSLIGIPIGILCGLGGIGVTLYFIGDKFSFMDVGAESVKMVMDFSPLSVIAAAIIAFITVLISAYIPSNLSILHPMPSIASRALYKRRRAQYMSPASPSISFHSIFVPSAVQSG